MERGLGESNIYIDGLKHGDISLLKAVASEAAEQAVQKTFIAMGLDPEQPLKAQADMQWLRATRERCENVEGKAILTLISLLVVAIAGAAWVGIKFALVGRA